MFCYKDRSYCADQEQCKTKECSRRLTDKDNEQAKQWGMPIAWMPFRDTCNQFKEITITNDKT